MASPDYVQSQLGGLPSDERAAWRRVFDYTLKDIAFGAADDQTKSENLRGVFYTATTPSTSDTEFSISHGLGRVPRLVFPVLPLNVVNAQTVSLKTTRAADSQRVYLSSPTTSAAVYLYVE